VAKRRQPESPPSSEEPSASARSRLDPLEILAHEPLAGLGTLVAIVAHEIQNPITYVLGNLQALRERVEVLRHTLEAYQRESESWGESGQATLDAEAKLGESGGQEAVMELVDDALEGACRIRSLVGDLLTLSRPGARSATLVDVNEVLGATLRLASRQIQGRAQLIEELRATRLIQGEPARLGQVFLNLMTNALEACEPPDPKRHQIRVHTRDTEGGVRIEVHDTGVGVPSEAGSRVFEPFFTTRAAEQGMGLGLYLSRRIVEDHGGAIGYEHGPRGGSIFWLVLPEGDGSVSNVPTDS
jgi:signal transduction histidine kinase